MAKKIEYTIKIKQREILPKALLEIETMLSHGLRALHQTGVYKETDIQIIRGDTWTVILVLPICPYHHINYQKEVQLLDWLTYGSDKQDCLDISARVLD